MKDTLEFHAASVPSFAANVTMQYLNTTYPGQKYREVALNPMNPANKAEGWEVGVVEAFRGSGRPELLFASDDGKAKHFARPIEVSSPACLTCHGSPQHAPRNLVDKYGAQNGFGWTLGEVVGAQVVSVPSEIASQRLISSLTYFLATSFLALSGGFFALRTLLKRGVMQPMQNAGNAWKKLASEDALTGIASRHHVLQTLERLISQNRSEASISVIFLDIDHFKRVNDTWGHLAGDQILHDVAQRIKSSVRHSDGLGRYGGEELLVVLPNTARSEASVRAQAFRHGIASVPFLITSSDGVKRELTLTASLGVAEWVPGESAKDLLLRADAALYAAKEAGRDRVEVA